MNSSGFFTREKTTLPALRYATVTLKLLFGVARVSRLIGMSDTTYKRPGWQVPFRQPSGAISCPQRKMGPDAQNATPNGVAFWCPALVTGLPIG